jgi:hypothetical protein
MNLRPVGLDAARRFVGDVHRHNLPPKFGLFAVGAEVDERLVGVAIVGRPVARMLDDGWTCEVVRLATDGTPNACSMLYGAASRAAKALGYRRIYTYTLQSEPGSSLKASGWTLDAELGARKSWDTPSRPRVQSDLFGNERRPSGPKFRWVKHLQTTNQKADTP